MRWFKRLAWLLAVLVLLLASCLWIYASRALPPTRGELLMQGLAQPVTISRDDDGIPTIKAADLHGLMYGLGVAHAQDRLWQLETHRRIGSGRLAEAFGAPAVGTDRFLRALGVRRAAAAQWAQTQGEARDALIAYSQGINDYVHAHLKARPPEFAILGLPLEDWDPVDSLAWSTMMSWDLGGNWNNEVLRLRLARRLPMARINELMPPYPGEKPLPTADYVALYKSLGLADAAAPGTTTLTSASPAVDPFFERISSSGVEGLGSNNWVVGAGKSATGHALLANDPHLKLSAPALWYFARLEAPGIHVAGATMPGLPGVVLGQNDRIAWGFTNTGPDVQDLYLERLDAADPKRYQTPDGWAEFATVTEVIRVKGQPDQTLQFRSTRHGPVISDGGAYDDLLSAPGAKPAFALTMRWTALDPDANSVGVNLQMIRAKSVAEFVEASRGWVAPMQNMVVADHDDHIALIAPGRVPVRQPGNDLLGLALAPGWDAKYDWAGWLAFEALPQERDPARGWIATANQRIVAADYPHFLTSEWAAPYRHQRIEQMLQAKPKHALADLGRMQADVLSLAAVELMPYLQKTVATHPLAAAAMQQLQGFDGTLAADRAAPLILWAWTRHLTRLVFADELGPVYERTLSGRTFRDALQGVIARNDAWWCDDKSTPAVETCTEQMSRALDAALTELQAAQGADPAQWQWGRVHQARSEHRPFSNVPLLAKFFELRTPVGGDTYTVNVSRVRFDPGATGAVLYLDEHGPSLRALYDLADPAQSRFMHSTGQSGIFWSPLYRHFVEPWSRVEYLPLWPKTESTEVLVLKPGA
jgi:penicillin amidase